MRDRAKKIERRAMRRFHATVRRVAADLDARSAVKPTGMTRELISRDGWDACLDTLGDDLRGSLTARLIEHEGGATCTMILADVDVLGRLHAESNPCPADPRGPGIVAFTLAHEQSGDVVIYAANNLACAQVFAAQDHGGDPDDWYWV